MKTNLLIPIVAAVALGAALPSPAALLINLDATNKAPGNLNPWPQEAGATVAGNFTSAGATVPQVTTVGGVTSVQLLSAATFYAGPGVPLTFSGNNPARTFEVWAYNPTIEVEETLLAIGRRGGPGGTNYSFNYGSSPLFGAFGAWTDAYDAGWSTLPAAGQWHHLVMTFDGAYTRFYADGFQTNFERPGVLNTYQSNPSAVLLPFIIGGQGNNVSPFAPVGFNSGLSIAKVRVHDVVLTPVQIASQYAAELSQFDVPAALSLTAGTATYMPGEPVTLTWATHNAASATITPAPGAVTPGSGSVVVYPSGGPVTYTLTATKGANSFTKTVTLAPVTAAPALVHRWSFNEPGGTAVLDSVGAGHGASSGAQNGTIIGTNSATPGTANQWTRTTDIGTTVGTAAVRLGGGGSGSAAYIDLPNNVMSGLTQVTFEGWMTLNGAQTWSRYFDFGINTAGEQTAIGGGAYTGTEYMTITAQVGGTTTSRRISIRDNNAENLSDAADTVTYNTQFHFAAVYDPLGNAGVSPAFKYYKNGTLTGTLNTAYRPQDLVFVNNWLGRSNFNGDANTNGTYDEFRIWSLPLTPAQITSSISSGPDGTPPVIPVFDIAGFRAFPPAIYKGESVRLSWVAGGSGATVSINNGVTVPNPSNLSDFVAITPTTTATYTLTLTDGVTTKTATASVVVLNGAPVACSANLSVPYETATPVTLSGNNNGGTLTYTIVAAPAKGVLSGTPPALTYTPNAGASGADFFTWKSNDGYTDSNVATVSLTIGVPQAAPTDIVLSTPTIRTDDGVGNIITRLQATDANAGETFTWSLVSGAGDANNGYFSIAGNQLISTHNFSGDNGQTFSVRLRATDSASNTFEKVVSFTVQPADLHVKINEIYYNSPNNLVPAEFIELYNPTGADVNMAGWQFSKGISYVFPNTPAAVIPAGGYVIIAENRAAMAALYGVTALGPWTGAISNDGDEIILRDITNTKVDGVEFENHSPWPVPPNGDGPSLELVNTALDNDIGGHWRAASAAAVTPYLSRGAAGWRFRPGLTEVPAGWKLAGFSEGAEWRTGVSPVGMFKVNNDTSQTLNLETNITLGTQLTAAVTGAGADMGVFVNSALNSDTNFTINYRSVAMRRTFNVGATPPNSLVLRVLRSDAAVVWINGTEVGRFGFPEGGPSEPVFNTTAIYEHSNDPWSELILTNTAGYLNAGDNQIAIEGWVKGPRLRATQEEVAIYNTFDFALDVEVLPITGVYTATPGALNSVTAANCPPVVREVSHSPAAPKSGEPVTVSAKISDRQGLGSVELKYQVVAPGAYIPAEQPRTVNDTQIIVGLASPYDRAPNPAFENPANWVTIPMTDNDGDGVFTATIPGQSHRTLMRYRIFATDLAAAAVQSPLPDDPSRNYAYFVYNGVPDWAGPASAFTSAQLTSLPVYHWIMRQQDQAELLAYSANQYPNNANLTVLEGRRYYNHEGTMVYDGKVYDHVDIRLRGGNSRYNNGNAGKRHFRFKFPKGNPFAARDQKGRAYPRDWEDMLFNKLFGNKGDYDWGLPYIAGTTMWGLQGVPVPFNHYVHFRMITGEAEAPTVTGGDFWGLYQALELPDGKNFLKSRDLPPGNFYKLSDFIQNGEMDERYQAPGAPDFAEDFDNIRYNIHQYTPQSDIEKFIEMPGYYKYNAVQEAIRHYDIFVEPTGRHRVKNFYWYFHPGPLNPDGSRQNRLGQCWMMPYDWDASFGPSWNSGQDVVQNAIYNYAQFPESPTWPASPPALPNRSPMQIARRNAIRDFRDLVFHRNDAGARGPVDDMLDDAAATLAPFWQSDAARWPGTSTGANSWRSMPDKVIDMKAFCFTGWSTIGGEPVVGAGGRAAYLDSISDQLDTGQLGARPTATYTGTPGYPVDGLTFTATAFSDPQDGSAFTSIQWRAGEIAAPTLLTDRIYEAAEVWGSGELVGPSTVVAIPGGALRAGHTYRVRVRYKDSSGRFTHWSAPLQFTATEGTYDAVLTENLYISEVMYKPANPTAAQAGSPNFWTDSDFEYVELTNRSATQTLNLTNARFTKGVDFDFAGSAITSLAPGGRVLVVRNAAAFADRYGAGKPVAGEWQAGQNLSNGGEQLKLSFGAGNAIHDITYDDVAPWPADADNDGISMVYVGPNAVAGNPDPQAAGINWKASCVTGGSPGDEEFYTLDRWLTAMGQSDPAADLDKDGWDNLGTFAFARDLSLAGPAGGIVTAGADRFLEYTYTRRHGAMGLTYYHEVSSALAAGTWSAADVIAISTTAHGDGTETVTIRLNIPVDAPAAGTRWFIRARAEVP